MTSPIESASARREKHRREAYDTAALNRICMREEVNSKDPVASSTANRCGVASQNQWEDVDVRRRLRHVAGLRGQVMEVPGYDLPDRVPGALRQITRKSVHTCG